VGGILIRVLPLQVAAQSVPLCPSSTSNLTHVTQPSWELGEPRFLYYAVLSGPVTSSRGYSSITLAPSHRQTLFSSCTGTIAFANTH